MIEGRENLGVYAFNTKLAVKNFCKNCGVPICSEIKQGTDEEIAQLDEETRRWYNSSKGLMAFNLRVINGLNVKDLNPKHLEGYAFIQPTYVEP